MGDDLTAEEREISAHHEGWHVVAALEEGGVITRVDLWGTNWGLDKPNSTTFAAVTMVPNLALPEHPSAVDWCLLEALWRADPQAIQRGIPQAQHLVGAIDQRAVDEIAQAILRDGELDDTACRRIWNAVEDRWYLERMNGAHNHADDADEK